MRVNTMHLLFPCEGIPVSCVTGADSRRSAPVRALLPSHWEYHFLQGPLECGPAPGIGEIFPGQTYNCWFYLPSLIEFHSVHDFLEEVIEDEGPFDVAWGFSAVRLNPKAQNYTLCQLTRLCTFSVFPPFSSFSGKHASLNAYLSMT